MEEGRPGSVCDGYGTGFIGIAPLVEETRNQVAVKRGPVVYCLESMDVEAGKRIDDILIPADIKFSPVKTEIAGSRVTVLDGIAHSVDSDSWEGKLYRKVAGTVIGFLSA